MSVDPHHPEPIEFWFDFSSPYAYFGSLQIEAIAAKHKRSVSWRPFLLGAAFQVTGMQSFSKTPVRGDYARHDWDRLARKMGVSFKLPPNHPVITVAPGRAFLWLEQEHAEAAVPFARKLFATYYGEGIDASGEDAVLDIASTCGAAREPLAQALRSADLKSRFKARTDLAIQNGIFGSPFFLVDGEPFWGSDRISMVDEWLTRGGW